MKLKRILFAILGSAIMIAVQAQCYNLDAAREAVKSGSYEKALDYLDRDIKDHPKQSVDHYYKAYAYFCQKEYAHALTEISAVFKLLTPKEKRVKEDTYHLRGRLYSSIGDNEKSVDDFSAAIKLNPGNVEHYGERAYAYYKSKKYERAEADYRQILSLNEGDVDARAGIARVNLAQKRYSVTDTILSRLIALSPEYATAHYLLGKVRCAQQKYNDAIESMFNALVLDEANDSINYYFKEYANRNYPLAIADLQAKMLQNPDKFRWLYLCGELLQNSGKYQAAINEFTKSLELGDAGERNDALFKKTDCEIEIGKYNEAIADCDEMISTDSTQSYVWGYRGLAKQESGDYTGAVADYTRAISFEPRESWFYYRRGWVLDEFLGKHNAGLSDYNQAIALADAYTYTYLNRGRLYASVLKDSIRAKQDFLRILSLEPDINRGGNCRQYALHALGRDKEAIEWMNKIVTQYPISGNYYDAACLYSLMGKSEESVSAMRLAFENGYRSFQHVAADDDLSFVRSLPEFKSLVEGWKQTYAEEINPVGIQRSEIEEAVLETVVIPLKEKGNNIYELTCKINELPLSFILDTGASDISISQTEVQFMLKNNYLKPGDIRGKQSYYDANGNVEVGTNIVFRNVEIGGYVLHNVAASVVENQKAPLLFGQSALGKYGRIVIDNEKKTITISNARKTGGN